MNTISLTPLFRNTVGFERFSDLLQSLASTDEIAGSYPPYNIEKYAEDRYGITMAVAGFTENDLHITCERDSLTIAGRIDTQNEEKTDFLYRGIAARPFERVFRLADHMKVTDAQIKDGLLRIGLVREIPEEQKPRTIPILNAKNLKTIDHASSQNDNVKRKSA